MKSYVTEVGEGSFVLLFHWLVKFLSCYKAKKIHTYYREINSKFSATD